jgi:hypothetical protein
MGERVGGKMMSFNYIGQVTVEAEDQSIKISVQNRF